jgi:Lipopolysaccharide kinase (Kdo/WaaP) family
MSSSNLQEQLRLAIESAERERRRAEDAVAERNLANQRAELERQRAEEAVTQRNLANERAEDERERAEDERERAEREQQRAEDERERAEREQQRAEDERERAEREQQRAEEAEQRTRKTTLTEYLDFCHAYLFQSISVQTDKSLSTQGDITSPKNKLRPDRLRPWNDFLAIQKDTQERLQSVYADYDEQRVFENLAFIEGLGRRVASRKIASEGDLANLQRETIETPVASIINHLQSLDVVQDELTLGNGIFFDNHPNALSDAADEVSQRLENLQPFTPGRSIPPLSGLRADQICVYTVAEDNYTLRKLAFVVEYKAPHKLNLAYLRFGLREMDVKSVIDRSLVPSAESPEHFQYHADRLVASVVTQTFSYMIQGGTQYGYITTGEAFVFLHIRLDDPRTVYYHLAEPSIDVIAQRAASLDFVHRTAVSQVLAFSLLALESAPGNQRWRQEAVDALDTWEVDYEAILHAMPDSVRKSPPDSEYLPETYTPVGRFTMGLRTRKPPASRTCRPQSVPTDDQDSPHASDHESPPKTPTRPSGRVRGSQNREARPTRGSKSSQQGSQGRSFCTQQCLQGLAEGGHLDSSCPNVADHRGKTHGGNQHRLNRQTFLTLLHQQLQRNRDDDCYPLGKQGARGALFKVSLSSHGYTVAAKGTVAAFVKDLQHECQVYQRLMAIQGICVPVCLGSLDLVHPYYYDIGVLIVHMMILSWAGESLDNSKVLKRVDQKTLDAMVTQSIDDIYHAGVLHTDLRAANVLWNQEMGRVMLIDFERSEMIAGFRQALTESSPNRKRKQYLSEKKNLSKTDFTDLKSKVMSRFMNEISIARIDIARRSGNFEANPSANR